MNKSKILLESLHHYCLSARLRNQILRHQSKSLTIALVYLKAFSLKENQLS